MPQSPDAHPGGFKPPFLPLDAHVHVVGNGSDGSGCRLNLSLRRRPFAALMLKHLGLPQAALRGNLEQIYVSRLLALVRESSLGAVVILAQDLVHDDRGQPLPDRSLFYVPNNHVLSLAGKHSEFIPAVSIHPARPDALNELESCLERGAAMMKLLPSCHNVNCNDPRFRRFWERMAEAGLPLLVHTGGEHTLPVIRREYADPRFLSQPLDCGVKVIAAHCATKSGLTDPEYFHIFEDMTRRFKNLYGDNSAFTAPVRGRHVRECLRAPLVERIVHGSDLPVPVCGYFPWLRGFLGWRSFRAWQRHPNVLERDYQLKLAMGFPPETFTRAWKILRLGSRLDSALPQLQI